MKTCFLFPGQGAQYPGMGKDLWETSAAVKKLFDTAAATTKIDVKKLLFEGTEQELKATAKTQVAVTLVNLAAAAVLGEKGVTAEGAAGFSLGEYAALCEAGVIPVEQLFPLVKARGEFMDKASRGLENGDGKPGMSAIVGIALEAALEILAKLGRDDVFLSNHTSPVQVVIGGTAKGLANAEDAFDAAGFRRIIPLKVSGPFHTPLIASAQAELSAYLANVTFLDPKKPVYSNVTGKRIQSGAEARALCIAQVVSPVKWVVEEEAIKADGFTRLIETGPGTVLKGLWKAFAPDNPCLSAGKLDEVIKITEGIQS